MANSVSKAYHRLLWDRHDDFHNSGSEHHMETGQRPKEPPRGVQQDGEKKKNSHTIFIAKVINEFLKSFSTWTDFSTLTALKVSKSCRSLRLSI